MSVKLLDNEAFYGYRVRRTVDARLYQEYFSLKKNGKRLSGAARKRVQNTANRRDRELAREQVKARQAGKAERCFNPDGSVRGISLLLKTEKSGTRTPIFQVGIASELDGKIICTSYSINAHGRAKAWKQAIETYARHKGIGRASKLFRQLLDAVPSSTAVKAIGSARRPGVVKKLARKSVSQAAKKPLKKAGKKRKAASKKAASSKAGAARVKSSKKAAKKIGKKKSGTGAGKSLRKLKAKKAGSRARA